MNAWSVLIGTLADKPENHPTPRQCYPASIEAATRSNMERAERRKQQRWEVIKKSMRAFPDGCTLDELLTVAPYTRSYLSSMLNRMESKKLVRYSRGENYHTKYWFLV
jgi:hypothetical protein